MHPQRVSEGVGPSADRSEVKQIAADKLGGVRFGVRGEIRSLTGLLEPGERVASMAMGTSGLRGRLIVATDRRLLLIFKLPILPVRWEEFSYQELGSARVIEDGPAPKLVFVAAAEERSFEVYPGDRAEELANLIADRIGAPAVSIPPAAPTREERVSLPWWLIGLAALSLILWIFGIVPWAVGLATYAAVSLGEVLWLVVKGDNRQAGISAIASVAVGVLFALTISR